jgi:hypothetical protein
VRRFARTYLITFTFLAVVAIGATAAIYVSQIFSRTSDQPRPTFARQVPYELSYRADNGTFMVLHVDADGRACDVFSKSALLISACSLANFVDPSVIASDAHGELNTRDTSAMEGIIWRGRLDKRPDDCDESGLLGDRLARCRAAVADPNYSVTDSGFTVSIGY